jgi:hypothetical protein
MRKDITNVFGEPQDTVRGERAFIVAMYSGHA